MAMYANVIWNKVSSQTSQPLWAVLSAVWDEQGNIVYDEKGKPVVVASRQSPSALAPSPAPTPKPSIEPTGNIPIIGA